MSLSLWGNWTRPRKRKVLPFTAQLLKTFGWGKYLGSSYKLPLKNTEEDKKKHLFVLLERRVDVVKVAVLTELRGIFTPQTKLHARCDRPLMADGTAAQFPSAHTGRSYGNPY